MNKRLSILSLMAGLLVCSSVFVACGGDDGDEKGGGGGGSSQHIVKMIDEDGSSKYEYSISYDGQGRVSRIVTSQTGSYLSSTETTYQYSADQIITKSVYESKGYTSNETHTYTLANGLIVKDVDVQNSYRATTTFSYDADGYLASMSEWGDGIESSTKNFVWKDGNLTQLDGRSWTYSSTPWPKGMFFYYKGTNMDKVLFALGYLGKTPKTMPSKYDSGSGTGWTFEYAVSGGVITMMTINNKGNKEVTSYVWQ